MIISFVGPAGSGKDTAFSYIKEEFPDVVKLSNSGIIKDVLATITGLDRSRMDDFEYKMSVQEESYGKTVRECMIAIGDGMRDLISPNIWADANRRIIMASPEVDFIKTDDRYPEETRITLDHGGILVYIDAPNRKIDPTTIGARSESHMEYMRSIAQFTIVNNFDEVFKKQVLDIARMFLS